MARPFRPAGGPYAASVVLAELARLWDQAADRMAGRGERPTQRRLAGESGVPLATVNSWATGTSLPQNLDQLDAVGAVLARWAGEEPPDGAGSGTSGCGAISPPVSQAQARTMPGRAGSSLS